MVLNAYIEYHLCNFVLEINSHQFNLILQNRRFVFLLFNYHVLHYRLFGLTVYIYYVSFIILQDT